jgi:hypothetical protein
MDKRLFVAADDELQPFVETAFVEWKQRRAGKSVDAVDSVRPQGPYEKMPARDFTWPRNSGFFSNGAGSHHQK